jgi:hypothetical protein
VEEVRLQPLALVLQADLVGPRLGVVADEPLRDLVEVHLQGMIADREEVRMDRKVLGEGVQQ